MLGSANHRELEERLAPLYRRPDIQLVILFGSAAKGLTHSRSDIDLAILGSSPLDFIGMTNELMALLETSRIDVVDLRRASPLLAMEIVRSGRLLHERQAGQYIAFCSLALRRYVDTAKLRNAQRELIAHFLHARGLA